MKEYLLFDLDGTLTDPKIGITTCVQYALQSFGIEEPDLDKLEPFIGPPLTDSFKTYYDMSDEQAKEAVNKYRERFQSIGLFENEIYPGIRKMLKDLKKKGMHLAIASSKPTVFVEQILEHFRIRKYFEVIVGSELDGTRGTKAEVVQEALNRLFRNRSIAYDKVYMIGDRKFDVEGARAFGVESIGVTYGYGGPEELMEAHADYIVLSVEELHRFLMRGYEDICPNTNAFQKTLALMGSLLIFLTVRIVAEFLLSNLFFAFRNNFPASFFSFSSQGEIIGFSKNMGVFISGLGFVAAALVLLKRARFLIRKTGEDMALTHLFEESVKNRILLLPMTVGLTLGCNLLFFLSGITASSKTYEQVAKSQFGADLWMGLICFGVLTPIAEELLFRGILYGYLRHFCGIRLGMLFAAVLFGVYHMNPVQTLYGCIMGFFFAYAYEYFGSFLVPVAMHMAANLLAYLLTWSEPSWLANWPACLLFISMGLWSFFLLVRQKKVG